MNFTCKTKFFRVYYAFSLNYKLHIEFLKTLTKTNCELLTNKINKISF